MLPNGKSFLRIKLAENQKEPNKIKQTISLSKKDKKIILQPSLPLAKRKKYFLI